MAHLGIDIGGTKLVLAVGRADGRPIHSLRRPMTLSGDWRTDLEGLVGDARQLLAEADLGPGERLETIGASVPGPADSGRGVLINPPNLTGWQDVPIGSFLQEALEAEVRIENDANAAALAEARFGAGQGVADLVYLTMSTGIGAGLLSDGKLIRGAFGGAGEAGHFPLESPGHPCACGLSGCFEAYAGGNALRDRLRQVAPVDGRIVELAGGDRSRVTPEHLVGAAREGDAFALEEFGRWLDYVARGMATLSMITEPKRFVLGTIAVAAGEALCFAPLRERFRRLVWPRQAEGVEIVPAELGDALPQHAGLAVALEGRPMDDPAPVR